MMAVSSFRIWLLGVLSLSLLLGQVSFASLVFENTYLIIGVPVAFYFISLAITPFVHSQTARFIAVLLPSMLITFLVPVAVPLPFENMEVLQYIYILYALLFMNVGISCHKELFQHAADCGGFFLPLLFSLIVAGAVASLLNPLLPPFGPFIISIILAGLLCRKEQYVKDLPIHTSTALILPVLFFAAMLVFDFLFVRYGALLPYQSYHALIYFLIFWGSAVYVGMYFPPHTVGITLMLMAIIVLGQVLSFDLTELSAEQFGFAMTMVALLLVSRKSHGLVYRVKNRYDTLSVLYHDEQDAYFLAGKTTFYGAQSSREEDRHEPSSYYYKEGPVGQCFDLFSSLPVSPKKFGLVGLGAGTIAAYGQTGQEFTFFEINPAVADLIRKEDYFNYFKNSQATCDVILGDGKEQLEKLPDQSFDVLIIDAYIGSDVPKHLIDDKAFELYFQKLSKNGILLCHTTNDQCIPSKRVAKVAKELNIPMLYQNDKVPDYYYRKEKQEIGFDDFILDHNKPKERSRLQIFSLVTKYARKMLSEDRRGKVLSVAAQPSEWVVLTHCNAFLDQLKMNGKW